MSKATDVINCNSSYVLIRHLPFPQDSERLESCRLFGCLGKYVIVMVRYCFYLTYAYVIAIIYLTREPKARWFLAVGKISVTKNSALVYQTEGAIFCVVSKLRELLQRKA